MGMIEIVDLVWIVAIVFPIIAVVEWATTGRIGINMWWLSPIIGSLIYAAIRKPIIRDSLAAGFIGWFIGTILGIPVGYVSTVQIHHKYSTSQSGNGHSVCNGWWGF